MVSKVKEIETTKHRDGFECSEVVDIRELFDSYHGKKRSNLSDELENSDEDSSEVLHKMSGHELFPPGCCYEWPDDEHVEGCA